MSQFGFNGKVVETQPLLQRAQQSPALLQDSSSVNVNAWIIVDRPIGHRVRLSLKEDAWRFMKMTDLMKKLENDLRDAETELKETEYSLQLTYSGAKLQSEEKAKKIERVEEIFSKHVSNVVEKQYKQYTVFSKERRKLEELMGRDYQPRYICRYDNLSSSLIVYCERAAEEAVSEKIEGWLKQISEDREPDVGAGYVEFDTSSKELSTEDSVFLREYPEAEDFLVAKLKKIVDTVEFVLEEKFVKLTGEAKRLEEADTFWNKIVMKEHSLSDHIILRVMNLEEFVEVFRERIRETKNDVFVTCNSGEGFLLLVGVGHTEADMTTQINDMLACFGDRFLELDERSFCFLAKNKWDIVKEMTKGKRVEFTPQHNDKKFGLLLMGSKSGNKQVEEAFWEYLKTSHLEIHLSDQQILLLQNPRSKLYVEEEGKSSGFEVEIDFATRSVSLYFRKDLHSKIEKWFDGLFWFGQLQKEDIPEMLNVVELKRIIESTPTVQEMFVLDSEGRYTGIERVMQDVDHLFQDLRSKYAKCEERLVLTKALNELLNDKDQKFLGERRQEVERVKWDRILEDKKHLLILAGPKIEVELFKELLLRASKDQKNETVDTQPGASAETPQRGNIERTEGNDSNGQGFSEEIGDTAEPAENQAWSTKSVDIPLKEETINFSSQDTKLKPSEVKQLFRSTTELTEGYKISSNDSKMRLKVTGTREVMVAVFQEIEAIMKEHEETEVGIFLTHAERDNTSSFISNLEKKVGGMNKNVHLCDKKFVICGPRKNVDECLSSFLDHIKEVSLRQTEHAPFSMKSCQERVSEFVLTALNRNKHLKDEIADKFLAEGYGWEMTKDETIILHAGSFPALRKARFLFREVVQEMSFHMSFEPILKMHPLAEIATNIERDFKYRVSIKPDVDAGILHVVCTAEDLDNLQLQIKDLRHDYDETVLTSTLPPEKLDVDKLHKDVTSIEPTLLNKFKVFSDGQAIRIVAKCDNLDLSTKTVETILLWEAKKPEVTSGIPNSAIPLEKEWFELLKRKNVYDWVEEVMQYLGFSVKTDKTVMIFSIKREKLVKGCDDFKSCFRTTHFDTRKTENYTPENIKEMLEAFSLSQLEGKLVVTIEAQQKLKVVSTSDVHEKVQIKLADIIENCSVVADNVEGVTLEDVSVIKRLFPENFHQYVDKNVQFKESKSGNFIIEGQRPDVDIVAREVKDLKSRIVRQEKDCSDIDGFLKEKQGKDVVKQVEKAFNCLIRTPIEGDEGDDLSISEVFIPPEQYVRLTHWTSDCGSSITVVQGAVEAAQSDILAIPVVGGCLPQEILTVAKRAPAEFETLMREAETLKDVKGKTFHDLGSTSWSSSKRVVLFWMPQTFKEGRMKEKEKVREIVKNVLMMCMDKSQISCTFVVHHLDRILQVGVKNIIRAVQEAIKNCRNCFDIYLLSDHQTKAEIIKILVKACPGSKKFNIKQLKQKFARAKKGKLIESWKKQIVVELGHLENSKTDVIVNSTGIQLDLSKGNVSKSLNKKTNNRMQKELSEKYPGGIKHNEVAVTDGRELHCKKVYHGALRPYHDRSKEDECFEGMEFFMYRCLKTATDAEYETIAFPVLGAGNLGYPKANVAEVMFSSVEDFFKMNPKTTIKTVTFVIFPKDTDVYKFFMAEQMKRNYLDNDFNHSDSKQDNHEHRVECGDVILQILENDIHMSRGMSDALLCFWDEEQMMDPTSHPVIGKCLQAIEWKVHSRNLKEKSILRTEGGHLSKMIFHVLIKNNIQEALADAFKEMWTLNVKTLQISIQHDLPKGIHVTDFVRHLLSQVNNSKGKKLCLVTLVSSPQCFQLLVKEAHRQGHGIVQYMKVFMGAVQSYAVNKGQSLPEESPNATEKVPKIMIFAKSSEDCQKAFAQLKKDIVEKRKEGTVVDPGKKDAIEEEFDSEAYSQVFPKLTLQVRQGIEDSSFWMDAQTSLRKLGKISTDEQGQTVIEGTYHNMIRARDYLMYLHSNKLYAQEDHFGVSKPKMDSEIKPPIEVKPAHSEAIQFFLGEKLIRKYCSIKDVRNLKRISFFCNEQNREYVESLKMRVDGIMQEEVDLQKEASQISQAKAASVPTDVMENMSNVFVKYIHSNHSILIFAEDWDSMTKAKRQVYNHLGKGKSDRSKRRFKGAESSTSKPESKARSFIVESGCGIAEGGHINVKVYKANITDLAVDAIVNAANGLLHHGGGVARAIAAAAGDQLRSEGNQYVLKHGQIPVTELAVTTAGKLPSRMVFHAVGPEWDNYTDKKECLEDLCLTILRCLCEAENRRLKTIAIPSISSAIFGVPQEECAKMYVRALKSFDLTVNQGSLQEVHFVDVKHKMLQIITDEMSRNWMSQPDNEDVKRDSAFIKHCLHPDAANISVPNDQLYSQSKNEFKVGEKLSVCIEEGELLKMEAGAIIAWETFTFSGKEKIIQQMLDEGGQSFSKGRQTVKGRIQEPYQVEVGPGGNLKQGRVLFAVVGQSTRITDFQTLLKKVYNRCKSDKIQTMLIPVFQNFEKVDGKSRLAIFIECIMDTLAEYSKQPNIDPLKLIIVDHQQHVVDECVKKLKEYSIAKEFDSGKNSNDDCPICLCDITNEEKLKCGHSFCKHCIDEAFKTKKVCPTCKAVCGTITGTMPDGRMTDRVDHYIHLPGYEKYSTIVIVYSFLDGIQKGNHPHPGKPYRGARRTAYLPDSPEGQEVLELLKVAWERRLTFTIDQSVTIGDGLDRVTWNEIHHKTNVTGGESNHGYPDPSYLTRVKEELAAQGVTMDDLGAAGTYV